MEERYAAVMNLYLLCYTQEEIAELVGIKQPRVNELLSAIGKYEIPIIPGIFTEDLPEDNATEKVKQKAETDRLARSRRLFIAQTSTAAISRRRRRRNTGSG